MISQRTERDAAKVVVDIFSTTTFACLRIAYQTEVKRSVLSIVFTCLFSLSRKNRLSLKFGMEVSKDRALTRYDRYEFLHKDQLYCAMAPLY